METKEEANAKKRISFKGGSSSHQNLEKGKK